MKIFSVSLRAHVLNFNLMLIISLQTVEDFHTEYNRLYNKSGDNQNSEDDDNLILRSFTDDPEIPLKQIKVLIIWCTSSIYIGCLNSRIGVHGFRESISCGYTSSLRCGKMEDTVYIQYIVWYLRFNQTTSPYYSTTM